MSKICVIGGGPAGMLAAGSAASIGADVVLFEKNEKLGKKMYITGKGRCNITNMGDIDDFLDNIISNKEFMYSSLYTFNNDSIIDLLEKEGIDIKVERGNRVFPQSNKSSDVIKGLTRYLKKNKVEIRLNSNVSAIEKLDKGFNVHLNDEKIYFDKVIVATGGVSYSVTGSTGDGYTFARGLGHKVVEPVAALSPIDLKEVDESLQGLSLKNIRLKAHYKNKIFMDLFGEMLFTHFGISGPVVLTLSSYINRLDIKQIDLYIDLKPALTKDQLDKRILRDFEKNSNKNLDNSLNELLPKKLIAPIIDLAKIDEKKTVHQITKEEREALVDIIKNYPLKYKGLRHINESIITAGGIDVREVNPSTMESKIVKDLYFVGEVLDIDALTGGYNLQLAYSTGFLAGINV